jgi:ribonuclease P protein component
LCAVLTFGKADRIRKHSEFLYLARFGKKVQNQYFIAIFGPGTQKRTRLGMTVSKKVGQAVIRNQTKRFIKEFFRLNRHHLPGTWDINIIAKKDAAGLTSTQAFLSLKSLFKGIKEHTSSN